MLGVMVWVILISWVVYSLLNKSNKSHRDGYGITSLFIQERSRCMYKHTQEKKKGRT